PNGRRRIQFTTWAGERKTIHLGKTTQKDAEKIRTKVEAILSANRAKSPFDCETASWLADIDSQLSRKLEAVGLTQGRRHKASALGEFLEGYIKGRSDVKPNTHRNLLAAKTRLVEFFGAGKNIQEITAADADAFLVSLRERYANGTAGRTVKRA